MIPKIIHQIWIGDQSKMPKQFMDSWKEKNPSWQYMLWADENLPPMINKRQFDAYTPLNGKADILRYEVLKQYGGFFIDADSECIKPLEDFLLDNDSFACYESEIHRPWLIANGYLAGVPNCKLFDLLIKEISGMDPFLMNLYASWILTGPVLLTSIVKRFNYSKLKVYPSHYFIPSHFCGGNYSENDHVFCRQYWGTTTNSYKNSGKITTLSHITYNLPAKINTKHCL